MEIYWLALGTLAVWRLTHLLQAEQGPWAAVGTLRHWAESRLGGEPFKCFYCVSLWVALPLALLLGRHWGERLLLWPALSAGAILLEGVIDRLSAVPQAAFVEDDPEEDTHAMLRQNRTTMGERPGQEPSAQHLNYPRAADWRGPV